MLKIKYSPEIFCILLFVICSMMWSYSTREYEKLNLQFNQLTLLETVSIKHKVELLSTNFNDSLHYDNFSQLQAQIERLAKNQFVDFKLKKLLEAYSKKSMNYMQLVTMIKTSKRLLSNDIDDSGQEFILLDTLKIKMFNYIATPSELNKGLAYELITKIDEKYKIKGESNRVHLFKLHCLFILDNYENAVKYRNLLMDMPILSKILLNISNLHKAIESIQYERYISGFCSFLSIILIFVIIFKRQHQALKKKSKDFEHAAEAKTQFLANMSHEIRTPMTGIIGLLDLCLKTSLSEEQKSYLEKVQFSANSLLTIINDILDFSKIESGELTIESIPFEHNKVIDSLNVMIGQIVEEKGIELIFDLDPKIPSVVIGDPVRLTQILLNLLANAVKFTNKGHVILKTRLIEVTGDNKGADRILYQIEDTGIGLSQEEQSKLFQRFSQADESTTRKYGGTGLGLAITKLLVDFMSGDIKLRSKKDIGSVFSIYLPLLEQDKAKKIKLNKFDFSNNNYQSVRLLLLEDNEITQSVIAKMADYCQVTIDVVNSVNKAINLCKTNQYDIALIDWNLKVESGLDFVTAINQESYCPKFLVICSAYSKSYIDHHSDVDVNLHYLAKPLTLYSFTRMLNLYLQPKLTSDSAASTAIEETITEKQNLLVKESGDKQTILLVEDNKINRLIATKILESLGLLVDVAVDGCEALSKVSENNYLVVLMDIQMPNMDGIEATIELRKTYSSEQLKIVALTANITTEEIAYYKSIGMDGHLGKPYEIDKIKKVLSGYYQSAN